MPNSPNAITQKPVMRQMIKAVCIASDVSLSFLVPRQRATTTFTPFDIPMSMPVKSMTMIVVEPTAPSAFAPANCPTTAMSDILKST